MFVELVRLMGLCCLFSVSVIVRFLFYCEFFGLIFAVAFGLADCVIALMFLFCCLL